MLFVLFATGTSCSAASSDGPRLAAERIEGAGEARQEANALQEKAGEEASRGNHCHSVVSCTFFGLGAVIAVPFWFLGAVLGLVF